MFILINAFQTQKCLKDEGKIIYSRESLICSLPSELYCKKKEGGGGGGGGGSC